MSPSIESFPIQKLDTLLAQTLGNNIQIKHVEWKLLNAPGENYGSDMLAINVIVTRSPKNTEETLNLVAKLPPTSAFLLDLFNSPVSFKKEIQFYNSMAKEFMKLQIESGMNDSQLVPKFYGGRLGLNPDKFDGQAVILLENLKCNGYITEDRIFGLDKKHTEFAIKCLAKMHALVIALKLKKPQLYNNIVTELLIEITNETTEKCLNDMIQKILIDLQNMEEIKPYMDNIKKSMEYCKEQSEKSKKVEEPWGTMIHNDFWVNNMMFKHDEQGEIIDMKIVDFQLNIYDYGVKDLIFFLISSANKDTLDNELDYMLDLYYSFH
uniref:CHK kinase-like domain-containing protein n=1 Tax=Apis cerana TaxID=7461 RepID=V9IMI2_APICE